MKIWNGDMSDFYDSDDCQSCLIPSTCARLSLLRNGMKHNSYSKDDYLEVIISKCPDRVIKG